MRKLREGIRTAVNITAVGENQAENARRKRQRYRERGAKKNLPFLIRSRANTLKLLSFVSSTLPDLSNIGMTR
jgi:hypothetical protein